MMFDGRPFPNVGLRGTSDPATCEDCHRDRRHRPKLVTGPLGGPTGPRPGRMDESCMSLDLAKLQRTPRDRRLRVFVRTLACVRV